MAANQGSPRDMKSYKTYIILIFFVYLSLIILFHTELQRNAKSPSAIVRNLETRSTFQATDKSQRTNSAPPSVSNQLKNVHYARTQREATSTVVDVATQRRYQFQNISFRIPYKTECKESHRKIKDLMFQPVGQAYIYSAYYDNRKTKPFIRMMALVQRDRKTRLYCIFERTVPSSKAFFVSNVIYYEMCENHGRPYGGWILSCEVPWQVKTYPCQIRVSSERRPQTGIILPVLASNNLEPEPKAQFGLCIPPLFGYVKPELLIQFIEISLLLGANHLNFYTFQVHNDIEKILEYYQAIGLVTLTHWKLPISASTVWYKGQLLTINDCLYRNMYHFKYIAFNDIDEFVVPHAFRSWPELMYNMEIETRGKNISGYSFPSAFFNIELREHRKQDLFFVIETKRTQIFSQVRTKVMVHPPNIFELGIHHISRPMPDYLEPFRVDPNKAFLHHYRKCVTDFDPRMRCNQLIPDPTLLRYEQTIKERSDATMLAVFGPKTTPTTTTRMQPTRPIKNL